MKKILPLLMAVMLVVALAVPVSASAADEYYYGDLLSPQIEETYGYNFIYVSSSTGRIYHVSFKSMAGEEDEGFQVYICERRMLEDGEWISYDQSSGYLIFPAEQMVSGKPVWADFDYTAKDSVSPTFVASEPKRPLCDGSTCPATDINKDNICDDCGYEFAVPRDYSPFTVKKFMNHIGQIFTSAVSWVSDVGAAILADPLLLAFTALPLCGLGIAVFRRLKNTV